MLMMLNDDGDVKDLASSPEIAMHEFLASSHTCNWRGSEYIPDFISIKVNVNFDGQCK